MNGNFTKSRTVAAGWIILLTLVAYMPALRGGFIWDDDDYVTANQTLRAADGLRAIWAEPGAIPQYYPLVHMTFWIEYHLWGLNPFGYHLVNVLLHALNAILLWRVLERLRVPWAWLAALIFAVHPVHVESVAWITERKNVLSGAFYLLAALAYLRFALEESERRDWRWYAAAFVFFVAALLSKTVTCALPVALLLVIWWKRGRLRWDDALPLGPLFVVGATLGLLTAWIERNRVGALGDDWAFSFAERCLIAGRALWFYAGKIAWPTNLAFIYERWQINAAVWWQWLFPIGVMVAAVAAWRRSRGLFAGVLIFVATLGPALGFVNVYPMRYSFVADHFQYLASIGLVVFLAAALARVPKWGAICAVSALAMIAWQQSHIYEDQETLWRDTLTKNPSCWMAHNNLGIILAARGQTDEALQHYRAALALKPDFPDAHTNVGNILSAHGELGEAVAEYAKALQIEPGYFRARYDLAVTLGKLGRQDAAIRQYQIALAMKPDYVDAHYNLGIALGRQGHFSAAAAHFAEALRLRPDFENARHNLQVALARQARLRDAVARGS